MRFTALGAGGARRSSSASTTRSAAASSSTTRARPADGSTPADQVKVPYPFNSGEELLQLAREHGMSISSLMLENEKALRPEAEVRRRLIAIWHAMEACVKRGCEREGILPGGLKVQAARRRAASAS